MRSLTTACLASLLLCASSALAYEQGDQAASRAVTANAVLKFTEKYTRSPKVETVKSFFPFSPSRYAAPRTPGGHGGSSEKVVFYVDKGSFNIKGVLDLKDVSPADILLANSFSVLMGDNPQAVFFSNTILNADEMADRKATRTANEATLTLSYNEKRIKFSISGKSSAKRNASVFVDPFDVTPHAGVNLEFSRLYLNLGETDELRSTPVQISFGYFQGNNLIGAQSIMTVPVLLSVTKDEKEIEDVKYVVRKMGAVGNSQVK